MPIWIAPNSLHIMIVHLKKPSPVDVHKSPDEASAKKSYNDHCIRVDRSTAFPPTSAQDPSVHFRMAILLHQYNMNSVGENDTANSNVSRGRFICDLNIFDFTCRNSMLVGLGRYF